MKIIKNIQVISIIVLSGNVMAATNYPAPKLVPADPAYVEKLVKQKGVPTLNPAGPSTTTTSPGKQPSKSATPSTPLAVDGRNQKNK